PASRSAHNRSRYQVDAGHRHFERRRTAEGCRYFQDARNTARARGTSEMRGPVRGEPRLSAWPAACLRRSLAMLCGAAVFLGVLNAAPVAAQTHRTVWDGVFTAEQAARGKRFMPQPVRPVMA